MYKLSWGKCKYSFTPAWFTDMKIDNMKVKWNKDQVKSDNTSKKEDNYLVWKKTNMDKGEKITVKVQYNKTAFGYLDTYKQYKASNNSYGSSVVDGSSILVIFFIIFIVVYLSLIGGGGYYRHRGFYGGYYGGGYYRGGCVRSSCACACARSSCASSCACACAGSGRAGCSKKDFYGTKINKKKLRAAFKSK